MKPSLRLADNVVWREVGAEVVILDLTSNNYFGLNSIGSRVWHLIAQNRPIDEIVTTLLGEFDVDAEQLQADIQELIEQLESKGLLIQGDQSPSVR
jgi:hypothetical protein